MIQDSHILPGMIDSHFHYIEMIKKGIDATKVIKECFDSGMEAVVDIATSISNFDKRLQFAKENKNLFITVGISPGKAENQIEELEKMFEFLETQIKGFNTAGQSPASAPSSLSAAERGIKPFFVPPRSAMRKQAFERLSLRRPINDAKTTNRLIAIGETGLDWYWNYGTPERQIFLFEKQLELAQKFDLPVIIHNREADKEILDILKKKTPSRGGIIHCFSSDYNFALKCIDLGFFISFAGNITYKKNTIIQEAAKKLPVSSILVETDSPFLSPQQVRELPNTPAFVGYTYKFIAESRGEDINNFIINVKNNFICLFGNLF